MPWAFPPHIKTLTVHLWAADWHVLQQASLEHLHGLTTLKLVWGGTLVIFEGHLPHCGALQQLVVKVPCYSASSMYKLSALAAAAACGVRIKLCATVQNALSWQSLARSIACIVVLDELRLNSSCSALTFTAARPAGAVVCCRELTLWACTSATAGQLLAWVECQTLHCLLCLDLQWSFLSAQAGIYVTFVSHQHVFDCDGTLPALAGPWALVLLQPQCSSVTGLPLDLFVPGPRGCLVWRNALASDADLERALDKLRF